MLAEHWDKVEAVAQALLKYETLQADDVGRIMRGEALDKPTVAELLKKESAKAATAKVEPSAPAEDVGDEPSGDIVPSPA